MEAQKIITLDGYLMMKEPTTGSWKKRYLKLCGGKLEYYVTKKDPDVLGVITLRDCKVKIEKLESYMQVIQLQEATGTVYLMYASPLPETLLWKDAITLAITQPIVTPVLPPTLPPASTTATTPSSTYSDYTTHVQTTTTTTSTVQSNNNNNNTLNNLVQLFFYLVSSGETISDIAAKFGVTVPWIQGCNSQSLDKISEGSYVIVPFQGELPAIIAANSVLMQAHISRVAGRDTPSVDDSMCKICFEKPINTVLLECGHSALCEECAHAITGKPCPFCRRPVSRVVLTHAS